VGKGGQGRLESLPHNDSPPRKSTMPHKDHLPQERARCTAM